MKASQENTNKFQNSLNATTCANDNDKNVNILFDHSFTSDIIYSL